LHADRRRLVFHFSWQPGVVFVKISSISISGTDCQAATRGGSFTPAARNSKIKHRHGTTCVMMQLPEDMTESMFVCVFPTKKTLVNNIDIHDPEKSISVDAYINNK